MQDTIAFMIHLWCLCFGTANINTQNYTNSCYSFKNFLKIFVFLVFLTPFLKLYKRELLFVKGNQMVLDIFILTNFTIHW